jgi:hypothetical protein
VNDPTLAGLSLLLIQAQRQSPAQHVGVLPYP